ncbi:hypothetical protein [Actinomadura verrucosospora]|uniref:Uncharacterized protein n=1 Tax=Actinomadura verrucosospora TaxID=46165 RepID=A0A7D3VUK8_ACTVE|nr:hypothetical protein [Actinomadura verrucosospora]QKG23735.1 hypothetical protein ACTIVE_5378 [Actinomadura verrucosospora]
MESCIRTRIAMGSAQPLRQTCVAAREESLPFFASIRRTSLTYPALNFALT